MRQTLSTLQKVKTVLHVLQALLIFVAACITIAVFTSGPGHTDGRSKWFFALCFISIPALIYLSAVPMWSRAMNVAKSLWFAIVDVLFAIFWLSAFAAVLAWNRAGITQGATDKKIEQTKANCTVFAYGNEKQCKLSYTASSFGVVIFLLFVGTSIISILYTVKSKKHPEAEDPWLAKESTPYALPPGDLEASHSKDPIWDDNTQELDGIHDADNDSLEDRANHGGRGNYSTIQNTETDEGIHPGRPWAPLGVNGGGGEHVQMPPLPMVDMDTSYRGGGQNYQAPSALSPNSYHVDSPAGYRPNPVNEHGDGHTGYSFSRPEPGR